ncbi:hypothetical protein GGR58DRAFT_500842 [Xylaria digitata]|nr:hypothetical protein GGR58DRAFT_500842 [Xylaria digitata]
MDKDPEAGARLLRGSEASLDSDGFSNKPAHSRPSVLLWLRSNFLAISFLGLLLYISLLLTFKTVHQDTQGSQCHHLEQHFKSSLRTLFVTKKGLNGSVADIHGTSTHQMSLMNHGKTFYMAQLLQLNANSTDHIRTGDGYYIGILGVYHHLHCLNNLRRIIHWDYYKERIEWVENTGPFNHCIDAIRQSLMCHANTEMHTGIWVYDPEIPHATALGSHAATTCVNWESLDGWARGRALVPGTYSLQAGPFEEDTA